MKYSISREELADMIDKEPLPAVKQILTNHLQVMDGHNSECTACMLDYVEPVTEVVEEVVEEVMTEEE